MKTPGTPRSELTRARLSLLMFAALGEIPDDKTHSVSGYWSDLNYFGPKSRSAAEALGRYLSEANRNELTTILDDSDREGAEVC